jgi:hypothetical protein
MSFASVVHVQPAGGGDLAGTEKMLREHLIPMLKGQPGFQSARFFRGTDGTTGMGIAVFDTEEHANAGRDAMVNNRPPEAPPVTSSAVYEIFVEV